MVTSEFSDEVELVASVAHSQGKPSITFESKNTAQQGASVSVVETSNTQRERASTSEPPVNDSAAQQTQNTITAAQDEPNSQIVLCLESIQRVVPGEYGIATTVGTSLYGNVSPPEGNVSHQPASLDTTGEPHGNITILSSTVSAGTSEQLGRKAILKDIFLKFSSPDHCDDEPTLVIMRGDNSGTLRLTKISSMIWKALEDLELDHNEGDIMLIVRTNEGGDVAFMTLTADEIHAMSCAEEAASAVTLRELALTSVKEDSPIPMIVRITCTVASSLSPRRSVDPDPAMIETSKLAWLNAEKFQCRFHETGNVDDVSQAISQCEKAISFLPLGLDISPPMSDFLGSLYSNRFEHTENILDINCAICYHQKAVDGTPAGHTNLPGLLNHLGISYIRRFTRFGELEDIECAICHHQRAIDYTPFGHEDLPSWFTNLGVSYVYRFERTGHLEDIDCSVSHHQRAVDTAPSDHPYLPALLSNLGVSYLRHFRYTGDLHSIKYAISYHQRAVDSTPSGHAKLPSRFNNLGTSYLAQFGHSGDLKDIDCAISHHQKAADSTPSGHIDLSSRFNNLGTSYLRRFERTGLLQDIDCALSHHHRAVASTPAGHIDLPSRFVNLGTSYLRRFERAGVLEDIDRSIYYKHKAVESSPSGHADAPFLFSNLGNSYLRRFERTTDLKDIDCAISHHQTAVDSTPSGHVDLPSRFNNLGSSYFRRFGCTRDPKDINCAISHFQKAVESTPSGHANLPSRLNNLGISYTRRVEVTNNVLDAQNSIATYRRGAGLNGSPSIRLSCAKRAAMNCLIHDRSQCLGDFALAITLLSEVAGLEQTINHRYANLQEHSDFVTFAVLTAFVLGRPDLALEWLEQGRCLVWNQLSQLRTPIDDLRTANATLANRFIAVASALESYGSRSTFSKSSSDMTLTQEIHLQNATQNHTIHAADYRHLLDEIRALPNFHNFLRPPNANDILSSLPSNGHVIVFNLYKIRCDALAVIDGVREPLHIPLRNFSLEQAEQLQKTLRVDLLKHREAPKDNDRIPQRDKLNSSSMSFVLKELWSKVVKPILEAIGYCSQLDPSARRRIWWCPTGPLAFLPLHAAGIYGSQYTPGSCISDYAVSSYIPTVQALKEKCTASSVGPKHTSLVLISPNTPDIPFTQMEIRDLKALFDRFFIDSVVLEDAAATTVAVKRELTSHSWAHFACHGIQDVEDPLKSGVDLHNGRLELLEIMRQKIPNPDLAFLSACQTSKGDLRFSEEVVHIAAGMLAAGYRGVVGTMWSISDRHGPEFAKHFYGYLLAEKGSGGLDSTRAVYALDHATRKVRETLGDDDTAFLTWVPYVHFGY